MGVRLVAFFTDLAVECAALLDQSIAVKGKLLCGEAPAANVRIKLWDEDDG